MISSPPPFGSFLRVHLRSSRSRSTQSRCDCKHRTWEIRSLMQHKQRQERNHHPPSQSPPPPTRRGRSASSDKDNRGGFKAQWRARWKRSPRRVSGDDAKGRPPFFAKSGRMSRQNKKLDPFCDGKPAPVMLMDVPVPSKLTPLRVGENLFPPKNILHGS